MAEYAPKFWAKGIIFGDTLQMNLNSVINYFYERYHADIVLYSAARKGLFYTSHFSRVVCNWKK